MGNSFGDIIKSNIVFGGIRVLQIIVNIIRTKIFAMLLGSAGMGIQSLLNNTIQTIHQFSTFGIYKTVVREISQASENSMPNQREIIKILHSYVSFFALFSAIICIIFSRNISILVFGSDKFSIAFVILSLGLIFEAFSNEFIAIFQGLRKIRILAKASLVGAICSLVVIVPIIYHYRQDGIALAIVASYFFTFWTYVFFYKRCIGNFSFFSFSTVTNCVRFGFPMLKMGVLLMVSYGCFLLLSLALNSYIGMKSGLHEVGFFNAANNCTYGNIVVFTSILSSDFYPRLSALQSKKQEYNSVFNDQVELLLIILMPIVCGFITFSEEIVLLLYSSEFLEIIPYVKIMAISLLLRIVWQSCSIVILSFGKQKVYFIYDAIIANGGFFITNIIAYHFWGLIGLSYSYILSSLIIMSILLYVIKNKFSVKLSTSGFKILLFSFSLTSIHFVLSVVLNREYGFIISCFIFLFAIVVSIYFLNKKTGIIKKNRR